MATSWKGIEQDLIQVAPVLGGLIGGPAGAAIGTVVSTALGAPNTPDAVQQALKADPEAAAKLQQAILDNKVQLQQLAITARQNELAAENQAAQTDENDRDSARKREETVQDWTPRLLAYGVTIGFFGILIYMMTNPLPQGAHDALLLLLGALQTAWVAIVSYYFGSSKSSDRKTELLAQAPSVNADSK